MNELGTKGPSVKLGHLDLFLPEPLQQNVCIDPCSLPPVCICSDMQLFYFFNHSFFGLVGSAIDICVPFQGMFYIHLDACLCAQTLTQSHHNDYRIREYSKNMNFW